MFLFPYSTDAPIYHWPIVTVLLIAVNLGAFLYGQTISPDAIEQTGWMLTYGDGLHPEQWVLSPFMHLNPEHLFGNMVYLWVFGIIVEGKIGWWRHFLFYMLIAVGESAVEQAAMLAVEPGGGSIGASAAVYGLMAIAAVWAPRNTVEFYYWFVFYFGSFEVPVAYVCATFVGFDLLVVALWRGQALMSLVHMLGALFGLGVGVTLLKAGAVDCEGWDLFTLMGGGSRAQKRAEQKAQREREEDEARQRALGHKIASQGHSQLEAYLKAGNARAALKLYGKLLEADPSFVMTDQELAALIQALHAAKLWAESAPFLVELIGRGHPKADSLRLKLAQICVVALNKPTRAQELLDAINVRALSDEQKALAKKIGLKAQEMEVSGSFELADDPW